MLHAYTINIGEVILGLIILFTSLFLTTKELTPKLKFFLIVFSLILILDGSNILPVLGGVKQFLNTAAFYIGLYTVANPTQTIITIAIVLGLILVGWIILLKVVGVVRSKISGKKGGVTHE